MWRNSIGIEADIYPAGVDVKLHLFLFHTPQKPRIYYVSYRFILEELDSIYDDEILMKSAYTYPQVTVLPVPGACLRK